MKHYIKRTIIVIGKILISIAVVSPNAYSSEPVRSHCGAIYEDDIPTARIVGNKGDLLELFYDGNLVYKNYQESRDRNIKGSANLILPLNTHELYMRLGPDNTSRENAYSSLFSADLGKEQIQRIRSAIQFSMPTGDSRFVQQIEAALGRGLGQAYRGRPRKTIIT